MTFVRFKANTQTQKTKNIPWSDVGHKLIGDASKNLKQAGMTCLQYVTALLSCEEAGGFDSRGRGLVNF